MARPKKHKEAKMTEAETAVLEPLSALAEKQMEEHAAEHIPQFSLDASEALQTELDLIRVELEKAKAELEEKKSQVRTISAREVSEEEMVIIKKQVSGFTAGAAAKLAMEKQKALDDVLVTGKFINRRSPGKKSEKLTYLKYNTDPVKWYDFEDGKIYTIPKGFADQLREHYYTPGFIQAQTELNPNKPQSAIHHVDTSNKKYDFVPLNF